MLLFILMLSCTIQSTTYIKRRLESHRKPMSEQCKVASTLHLSYLYSSQMHTTWNEISVLKYFRIKSLVWVRLQKHLILQFTV